MAFEVALVERRYTQLFELENKVFFELFVAAVVVVFELFVNFNIVEENLE